MIRHAEKSRWFEGSLLAGAVFAVLALTALMPGMAGAAGTGSISGVVTDSAEDPVYNLCVTAYDSTANGWDQLSTAYTDADGEYTLAGLETGDYSVKFGGCDFSQPVISEWYDDEADFESSTAIPVVDTQNTPDIDAELAIGGTISGRATNTAGGPNSDTCVTALRSNGNLASTTTTDSNGDYTLPGLDTGQYLVLFERCDSNQNVAREYYPDKGSRADATPISVTRGADTPGIDATLTAGGSITGKLTGSTSLAPALCIGTVTAYDSAGLVVGSDESPNLEMPGSTLQYKIDRLKTGDYRLRFDWACGWPPAPGESNSEYYANKQDLASATPIPVTEGSTVTDIDAWVNQPGGAKISGTVTDSLGEPMDGICVGLYGPWNSALINQGITESGTYSIPGLDPGSYRVQFADCHNTPPRAPEEFYPDKATLEEAGIVTVELDGEVTVDAQMATAIPASRKAKIGEVGIKGPAKAKKGKKALYRIKVTNSGDADATGVVVKVTGRGVKARTKAGTIAAGKTKTVRVGLKLNRRGKSKLTFRVTSANAGGKTVVRRVMVRK